MKDLRAYAYAMIGLPYKYGGDDFIEGYDCSGVNIELLQSVGMLPYRFDTTSQGLYNRFKKTDTFDGKLRFGDLLFFGKSVRKISHTAWALDGHRFIEAGGGTSKTKTRKDAARDNAFIRIRPLTWRKDRVAILRPRYPKWLTISE